MVSLRQRSSRPSYTSMAGLENLSDGEGSDAAGSSTAPPEADGGKSDDSESISSGASSEFQVTGNDGKQGNAKGKSASHAKSKGKGKATEGSDSAFEGDDADDSSDAISLNDEDEEASIGDTEDAMMEDDDELVELTPAMTTKGRNRVSGAPRAKARRKALGTATPVSGLPAYAMASGAYSSSTNDPALLPLAYRNIIQKSTEVLTKASGKRTTAIERDYERYKRSGSEGMSFGPVTPFCTRLAAGPREDGSEVKWVWEDADAETRKNGRRAAAWMVDPRVPLYQPWQVWKGEGYWKGMFRDLGNSAGKAGGAGDTGARKGKGRETNAETHEASNKGWVLREDVTLGLGDVGRISSGELGVLSRR